MALQKRSLSFDRIIGVFAWIYADDFAGLRQASSALYLGAASLQCSIGVSFASLYSIFSPSAKVWGRNAMFPGRNAPFYLLNDSCSLLQSLFYHLAERGADENTYFDEHNKKQRDVV